MDNDDALTPTALEKLYSAAEKFRADVVNICKNITMRDGLKNISTTNDLNEVTPESSELAERVKKFASGKIAWAPWCQFIRRSFLVESEIKFLDIKLSEDFLFAFFILCTAEKFVLFPEPVYIYRIYGDSHFHKQKTPAEMIHGRFGDFFIGMEAFEKFMSKFELFQNQPEYKYMVFDLFAKNCGLEPVAINLYSRIPAPQLDSAIRAELANVKDTTGLTAYIFARMSIFNLMLIRQQQTIQNQQAQIQQLQAQIQPSPLATFNLK